MRRAPRTTRRRTVRTVRRVAPWLCVCVCMLLCGAAGVVTEGGYAALRLSCCVSMSACSFRKKSVCRASLGTNYYRN